MANFFKSLKVRINDLFKVIIAFLRENKLVINKVYFVSIIVYFFLVFLPNITTRTPFAAFFNAGITKVIYRIVIALLFGFVSFAAFFANKVKINKILIFSLLGFFVFLIFASLFNLSPVTSTPYYNNYHEKVIVIGTIGVIDLLSYYGNLLFSYIFCFALFTCIPLILVEKDRFLILIDSFIIIMIVLCLLSYILDFRLYISALRFNYNQYGSKDISSLFPSKNSFGVFLFQGVAAALIAFHYRQQAKYRFIYIIVSILFSLTLVFTLCKDAIFALFVFTTIYLVYFLGKQSKKIKDYVAIGVFGIFVLLILILVILIACQKSLGSNSSFKKIYYFLGANPVSGSDNALLGRLEMIAVFHLGISGFHYVLGYGHAFETHAYIWSLTYRGAGNGNLHNSFLYMYGTGGLFYMLFYIGLIAYMGFLIFKTRKDDKKVFYLLFALLIAHTFYSFFESSILFLSGSSATTLLSILFFTLIHKHVENVMSIQQTSFCEVNV